jgi:hypothetical protein
MYVLLRLFVECATGEQAARTATALSGSLDALRPVQTMRPERYWKTPSLFELAVLLSPGTRQTFDSVVSRAKDGWTHLGDEDDGSSVWCRSPDSVFLLPEVAWAEVIYSNAGDIAGGEGNRAA